MPSSNNLLGGDEVHARTFGRLDAALGEHPVRFSDDPKHETHHLRATYLAAYHAQLAKLETTSTPKGEFRAEFPWHKSNGSIDEINDGASRRA